MRPAAALLLLAVALMLPTAAADPFTGPDGADRGLARWALSNPANYTLENVTLGAGATLARLTGSAGDTSAADFALGRTVANTDVTSSPGDVVLADATGSGTPGNITYTPTPAEFADTYLYAGGGGNDNFGSEPFYHVGYWGNPELNRALLRFPNPPLPGNATLLSARLLLYMYEVKTPQAMNVGAYRVTSAWTESGATWDTRDGTVLWNASSGGGDFDATAADVVSGITDVLGWYAWNVTGLLDSWRGGALPNHGLMLRQENDDPGVTLGQKLFYSGDATNVSLRPRLEILYTTPGGTWGAFESRVLDATAAADWGAITWAASLPAGTSLTVRTRTGFAPAVDGTWSPWSAPLTASGASVASPAGRYLQYEARLATTTAVSPVLHDVAVTHERYAAAGTVVTEPFLPQNLSAWGPLAVNWSGTAATGVEVAWTADGSTWVPAIPGTNLTAAPLAVRLRLTLFTGNGTTAPSVSEFSLGFALETDDGGGGGGGGGGNGQGGWLLGWSPDLRYLWLLLVPFLLLAGYTLTTAVLRDPFDATDLFLIHADGRLIRRVGGEKSPLRDELSVSGMFTIVAQFVKDSFRDDAGEGGELKSFRVDERDVAITRADYLFLALFGEGTPPRELQGNMARFLRRTLRAHGARLRSWDGLSASLGGVEGQMRKFLRKGYRRRPLISRSARE